MASLERARIDEPSEIRFLAELDKVGTGKSNFAAQKASKSSWEEGKGAAIKEGIKISTNLSSVKLFFCRLFGMTVNIQIGDKIYACGRSSLEHFLRRHAEESRLTNKIGKEGKSGRLEYADLAEGLKNLLANRDVQAKIYSQVVKSSKIRTPESPADQLYKDLSTALDSLRQVKVLGPYNNNFKLDWEDLNNLMSEAYLEPAAVPPDKGNPPSDPIPIPNRRPSTAPLASPRAQAASANGAAIPVAAVVVMVANAHIAASANSPNRQQAAATIALAQNDPAALDALQVEVDDVQYDPKAPVAPDAPAEQAEPVAKKPLDEIIREHRSARKERAQPQARLTPQQIAKQAAAKAAQRRPAVPPQRGLSESTQAEFRADRARKAAKTKVPAVNNETSVPTIEVSKVFQRAPARPAPLRPQIAQEAIAPAPTLQPKPTNSPTLAMLQRERDNTLAQMSSQGAQIASNRTQVKAIQEQIRSKTIEELNHLFETEKAFLRAPLKEAQLRQYRKALAGSTREKLNSIPWHSISLSDRSKSEFVLTCYQPKTGEGTLETIGSVSILGSGFELLRRFRGALVGNWDSEEMLISVQQDGEIVVREPTLTRGPMTLEAFKEFLQSRRISDTFLGKIEGAAKAATTEKAKAKKSEAVANQAQSSEREEALFQFANNKAYLTDPRAVKYLDRYAGGHVTKSAGNELNNHYAFSSTKNSWYLHRVDADGDVWRYVVELPASGGFTVIDPIDGTEAHYSDIPSMLKATCGLTDEQIETNTFASVWDRGFQS